MADAEAATKRRMQHREEEGAAQTDMHSTCNSTGRPAAGASCTSRYIQWSNHLPQATHTALILSTRRLCKCRWDALAKGIDPGNGRKWLRVRRGKWPRFIAYSYIGDIDISNPHPPCRSPRDIKTPRSRLSVPCRSPRDIKTLLTSKDAFPKPIP
jgi:hypothetical protein